MKTPKELVKGSKWYINFGFSTYEVEIVQVWKDRVVWKRQGYYGSDVIHAESISEFLEQHRGAIPMDPQKEEEEPIKEEKPKSAWGMFARWFNSDSGSEGMYP